ncbi:MAG: hypothetical protein ACXW3D_01245 [Caulobacteraceae bacterium]
MSRRKVKWPTVWVQWKPEMLEFFSPLSVLVKDARPPERVRVYHGRAHFTVVAQFIREDGGQVRCTARVGRPAS